MQILPAKKNHGSTPTAKEEELARANADAVFEFACRFVVMMSLPGWIIEEIYAEHRQSIDSATGRGRPAAEVR
jgi:hypothetical protein